MKTSRIKSVFVALLKVLMAFVALMMFGLTLISLLKQVFIVPPFAPDLLLSIAVLLAALATKSTRANGLRLPSSWNGCIGLALLVLWACLWNAWNNDFAIGDVNLQLALSALLVSLLTGFWEELFFRGFVLRLLSPCGVLGAVLVSSIFFAMVHPRFGGNALTLVSNMLPAFSLGLLFAVSRLQTNSIFPAVIAHAAINSVSSLFSGLPENGSYASMGLLKFSSYLVFATPVLVYCYNATRKNLKDWNSSFTRMETARHNHGLDAEPSNACESRSDDREELPRCERYW